MELAALRFDAPTIEGSKTVKVPAGTQPGDTVRLKGEGLPRVGGGSRGSLHVVFDVVVPKKLNRKQREIAQQLHDSLEG